MKFLCRMRSIVWIGVFVVMFVMLVGGCGYVDDFEFCGVLIYVECFVDG